MSTSNTVPKNIKNNWSTDGNVTMGKMNYRRTVCSLQTHYLISHTHQLHTKCFIFSHTNNYRYNYTSYDQGHICWISKFYKNYITRILNFSWWNFLHSTHNSYTADLQHPQFSTTVDTQNTTNCNTKNKCTEHGQWSLCHDTCRWMAWERNADCPEVSGSSRPL